MRGLKMGADDYVVKPFSAQELLAHLEAVLRRAMPKTTEIRTVNLGKAIIDFAPREIRWTPADRHELSETESALLQYLVNNRSRAVSREELLTRVWGIEAQGLETRTVDMHIARLRRTPQSGRQRDGGSHHHGSFARLHGRTRLEHSCQKGRRMIFDGRANAD